jgi:hypothetical protein
MKLDLLTNATVVDDAVRFVSRKAIEKLKSNSGKDKSKEPDCKQDGDKLEEEQEDETREITINQVF